MQQLLAGIATAEYLFHTELSSIHLMYSVEKRDVVSRDAEPEPEPEPTHFSRSRSRSRRNGLLGAGAVKNGAAPAPERDTIVEK